MPKQSVAFNYFAVGLHVISLFCACFILMHNIIAALHRSNCLRAVRKINVLGGGTQKSRGQSPWIRWCLCCTGVAWDGNVSPFALLEAKFFIFTFSDITVLTLNEHVGGN